MIPDNSKETRFDRIRTLLQAALSPTVLDLVDESHLHAGHAGAASGGSHYRLTIVAPAFAGLSLVRRHRLVYDSVHLMMQHEIHALAISALTPEQHAAKAD
ncbi:BolA family protein [Massilia sp. S19_KUP03_FR1]|uniref:BolA family protein n=1 Tax=Massilia sp. S19_KUP03_FR1 TaxID=3025503 RepID=UPI002FCDD7DE